MLVGTIMESNDATFFEDIFPMKQGRSQESQMGGGEEYKHQNHSKFYVKHNK
jgi:hypothetical protein